MHFSKSINYFFACTIFITQACLVSFSLNAQNKNNGSKLEPLKFEKVKDLKDVKFVENQIYIAASYYTRAKNIDSTTIAKLNSNLDPIWITYIGNKESTYPTELVVKDNKTYVIGYSFTGSEPQNKSQTLLFYELNKKGKIVDKKVLGKSYGKKTASTIFNEKILISYYTANDSINIIEIDTKNKNSTYNTNSAFKGDLKNFFIFNNKPIFIYKNDRKFLLNEFTAGELKLKGEIPYSDGKSEYYGTMNITETGKIHLYNTRKSSEILKYEINDKFEFALIEEIKLPLNSRQSETISYLKIFNNELWCFYQKNFSNSNREYALLKFPQEGDIKKIDLSGKYVSASFFINDDTIIAGTNLFSKNLSSFKTTNFYSIKNKKEKIEVDIEIDVVDEGIPMDSLKKN